MRPIKVLGLTVLAALIAMALVGTSSAMAEKTQLCKVDEGICAEPNAIKHVHEETLTGAKAKMLSSLGTIECNVLFLGDTLGSGTPLVIHGHFTYSECKRSSENCTVNEASADSLLEVLKESHETAKETIVGEVLVKCGFFINCKYNGEGLKGTVKGPLLASSEKGEVTFTEQALHKVSGAFCPETAKLDLVTMPLEKTYVVSGGLSSTSTSITTSLKGGGKEGAEITVTEGSKVKDTATLSGENASKATGTIKYAVYKDKECKELASKAGEGEVKEGKAPASEEKELEAAAVYYWQAEYGGDSMNKASTSTCSKEVLTVKAKTTLATKLSGGGKEGEEITVAEGSKVKDQATLSGTKSSTATGTIKYAVYKDKECKELASKAGEGEVKEGKAPASEEQELEAAAVYYWQAEYGGDSLHEASTSICSKEVLKVKANTSISTLLEGKTEGEELGLESEEIILPEGFAAYDSATISGTNSPTATGKITFKVYADGECKELVAEAGESSVEKGTALSKEVELEEGAYYWEASYGGDALHQAATSPCGSEILLVVPPALEWQVVHTARLCLINENPCTLSQYSQGTNFKMQNTSAVKFQYGLVEAVCSEFTLEGLTGVVGRFPTGSITTATANSCSWEGEECVVIPLATPYRFDASRFNGATGNGLFFLFGTDNATDIKFKIVCGGQTCIYGHVGIQLGLFTGGAPATTGVGGITLGREPGSEASCPMTALLEGGVAGAAAPLQTKITTPSPLFVTS